VQCPKNDLKRKQMKDIPYASIIGSLMCDQTCTRPDISFAVDMLGRYQSNPGLENWKAAKKVLRYLQGKKNHMLAYKKFDHIEVISYTDSDFVNCMNTRKSIFGYVYLLVGGAISWKSVKQSVIVASTMKVEFIACFEATIQANWLRKFILELEVADSVAKSLKFYCDNSAVVFFSKNNGYSKGTKHMELKYFVIREEIHKCRMSIEHISTYLMMVDPLTKGLSPKLFVSYVKNMSIMSTIEY